MRHVAPPLADLTAQAQTLTSAGDLAGARDMLADALGPADADPQRASPDLALAAALQARILIALGDPHAARTWAGFAHAAEERLHGSQDERTIAAAATHAAVLHRVGNHGRAAQLYRELVGQLTALDGPRSARVMAAEADLATAEHAAGHCTAARHRLAGAWSRHDREHGEDSLAGIKMLARLAAMERECGHDGDAHRHFAKAQELCARYLPPDHPLGRQVARLAGAAPSGRHVCGRVQRSTGPADGDPMPGGPAAGVDAARGPASGVTHVPAATPGVHPVRHRPPAAAEATGRHARPEPSFEGAPPWHAPAAETAQPETAPFDTPPITPPGAWINPPPAPPEQASPAPERPVPVQPAPVVPTQPRAETRAWSQDRTVEPPVPQPLEPRAPGPQPPGPSSPEAWPPESFPPAAHPDVRPSEPAPGVDPAVPPGGDRRLPVPVESPHRRPTRHSLLLAGLLVAGIATAAAIVIATLPHDDADPAAAPAPTVTATAGASAGGAPPAASASARPTTTAVAPAGLTLRDNRDSVSLTWRYPKGSEGPVLISGGRTGQEQRAFQQLPAGTTDYVVYGLNRRNNYCFSVAVVYTVDQVAATDAVCTKRK